jgi:hypothetical protein
MVFNPFLRRFPKYGRRARVTIGGAVYCSYTTGVVQLVVHVEKWARPPIGTLYVGALSDFPQNGGAAETPVYTVDFSILPEWA